jgi:hypothetical protein
MHNLERDAHSLCEPDKQAETAITVDFGQALANLKRAHCAAVRSKLTQAEHADFEAFLREVTAQSLGCIGWP